MTLIAASGVVIASAALFIVLSGFAGLKEYSLEFSSFVDPDLKVLPSSGKSFSFNASDAEKLLNIEGVQHISKTIEERVVLEFDNKRKLATLKGVDNNYETVTAIDSMVVYGQWFTPQANQIVSGWGISNHLSFGVLDYGKTIRIYVPKPGKGQITSVRAAFNSIKVVNVGVFQINESLDNEIVYSDLETAAYLMNFSDNQISSLEIKTDKNADLEHIKERINSLFPNQFIIKNRTELNDSLNKMLNTENIVVYLIFTLVIIIALFNVIGAIIMMILDKKESLRTLFNLGFTAPHIKQVFFLQGSLMTILGGLIGLFLGFVIIWLQQQFNLVMLTPSLPYPVAIEPMNFVVVILTISILGLFSSKVASSRISKSLIKSY